MKKTSLFLLSLFTVSLHAENLVLNIYQNGPLGGRIHHNANPGKSDKAVQHITRLPLEEVAVGPTRDSAISMAFETTPEFRQHIAADGTVRLALNVVKTLGGGAPADLNVALLDMGTVTTPDHFPQFGAFNKAVDFTVVKTIDADPDTGLQEIDVSKVLQNAARSPSADEPLIWFVIYLPIEKRDGVEGQHVVFSGKPMLIGIR